MLLHVKMGMHSEQDLFIARCKKSDLPADHKIAFIAQYKPSPGLTGDGFLIRREIYLLKYKPQNDLLLIGIRTASKQHAFFVFCASGFLDILNKFLYYIMPIFGMKNDDILY